MDRIKSICIEEELCQSHDGSLEQILKQMLSYKKQYVHAKLHAAPVGFAKTENIIVCRSVSPAEPESDVRKERRLRHVAIPAAVP